MNDEGYAFFRWHYRNYAESACDGIKVWCRVEWRDFVHKTIPAPVALPKRTYVGWFVPNSVELVYTLRSIQKHPGKRIHVEVLDNGPIRFYAEEV